jgi:hypothetical protein
MNENDKTESPEPGGNVRALFGGGGLLYEDARAGDFGQLAPEAMATDVAPTQAGPPWTTSVKPEPRKKRDWAEMGSTAVELVGIATVCTGFFFITLWIGLIVTGICLVALGVATSKYFRD